MDLSPQEILQEELEELLAKHLALSDAFQRIVFLGQNAIHSMDQKIEPLVEMVETLKNMSPPPDIGNAIIFDDID